MAYPNLYSGGGLVPFFPFCSNNFYELMEQCVGCDFAEHVRLAKIMNGSLQFFSGKNFCNSHVHEYPLPLYKCGICNQGALNAVLVYMLFVTIFTVLGNGWSLAVWMKQGTKRPQTIFKLSLTLSDFVFGLFVLPSTIASIIKTMYVPHEEYFDYFTYTDTNASAGLYEKNWEALFISSHTHFTGFILYLSQGTSLCSVLLLTIDRHLAITHHIKYYQIATRKKSIVIVVLVWLLVSCLGVVANLTTSFFVAKPSALFLPIVESDGKNKLQITSVLVYLIPLSVVFLSSCTVALLTSRKLHMLSRSSENTGLSKSKRWFSGLTNWFLTQREITRQSTKSIRLKLVRRKNDKSIDLTGVKKTIDRKITDTQIDDAHKKQKSNNLSQTPLHISRVEEQLDVCEQLSPLPLINSVKEASPVKQLKAESKRPSSRKNGTCTQILTAMPPRENDYIAANRTLIMILLSYAFCVLPLTAMLVAYSIHNSLDYDSTSEDGFSETIHIGFTVAVAIFLLSSLRHCVIYGIRNREYRVISRTLWRNIKSECSITARSNHKFKSTLRTKRRKTVTKLASSNPSQTVVH